ncbi:translation elongation factor Ts [Ponticaulis sp.]|uniref:translation elongation factor Ts n=1 Tax=Ponticaulis sp. TaxID=2020902 RepID=UPI000B716FFB|nr:translation elongation factor Ts [Ponticaulis sp.]MAI89444.1 elongation factor Ts [Ponticaulis sp.]OUY00482.1 MAG: translation elongation factor Ts [Hyphomonadaceae bacterium TMED5]|tara:strand:- start:92041 stop:92958 length:918 start_codon:yes stop_codon:yes gene_type:complete
MAQITAALVKDLREKTGAGMMDAKKALVENDGDVEAAIDWLRAKGLSKAAKKADRVAADGLVAAVISDDKKTGVLVELNAETDFVARNEGFQSTLLSFAKAALDTDGTKEALLAAPATSGDGTISDQITRLIATIGENITLRRVEKIESPEGVVTNYIHGAAADGLGRIGVLVALKGEAGADEMAETGRKVAMHIAATSPAAGTTDELDPELVAREKAVLTDQARESGKPEAVIEKMIVGRLNKFYKEVVLVEQQFVMNPDETVAQFLSSQKSELVGFKRMTLGEGIEKEEADFAAEVAAATKSS